jgi:hypothetical protein
MKYTDLSENDLFKSNNRERSWRTFKKAIQLPDEDRMGKDKGKLLICFSNRDKCRQMVVEPDAKPFDTCILPF